MSMLGTIKPASRATFAASEDRVKGTDWLDGVPHGACGIIPGTEEEP